MRNLSSPSKRWLALGALVWLAGCSSLPSSPTALVRYDLGHPPALQTARADLPAIALAPVQAPLLSDGSTGMRYRLAYADAQVLHTYAQARWSTPPASMVQQRMREHLGQSGRVVLSADAGDLPPLVQGRPVPVLRLALEEFSQVFRSPAESEGWVRIRATLVDPTQKGDVLMAQQVFDVRQPAAAANASGGVEALARAVDAIGQQVQPWLHTVLSARR